MKRIYAAQAGLVLAAMLATALWLRIAVIAAAAVLLVAGRLLADRR